MTYPEEATEWNSLFELISLDRVIPFYEDMGLSLPNKREFVRLIRQLLLDGYKEFGPDRTPDIEFVQKILEQLRSFLGPELFEHFYKWATTVFYWAPSDQIQWAVWDDIIPQRPHQMPKSLPPERWNAVARFLEAENTDDVNQRVSAEKHEPLSDWDVMMYARNNFRDQNSPEEVFGEGVDPLSPVIATVAMNRMQLAWPALWKSFSEDEKDILWKYAQEKIDEWQLSDVIPGGLMHPNTLHRQL